MLSKTIQLIMILLLPVFIILSTIGYISSSHSIYMAGYDKYNITEATGIERQDIVKIADKLIAYITGKTDILQIRVPVDGQVIDVFNEKELLHMIDVKKLFKLNKVVIITLGVLLTISTIAIYKLKGGISVLLTYIVSAITSLVIIPTTYLLVPKDFYSNFVIFHKVFFTNDLWILNPKTDILLQLHPLNFFMDMGIMIFASYVVINAFMLIISLLAVLYKKRKRPLGDS